MKILSTHRYAEVLTLALTGCEREKLRWWCEVDWARRRICIERSADRGTITATKTEDPRQAALPYDLERELRAHAEKVRVIDDARVFPSTAGTPRTPSSLHKPPRRAADAAGVSQRVTPQVLRRTFNTLLLLQGADRIVLRSQMGHCSEEMTERYAGTSVESKLGAVGELASNLGLGSQIDTNPPKPEKPRISGTFQVAAAGTEPVTSSV